jgi:hypothetical protein
MLYSLERENVQFIDFAKLLFMWIDWAFIAARVLQPCDKEQSLLFYAGDKCVHVRLSGVQLSYYG